MTIIQPLPVRIAVDRLGLLGQLRVRLHHLAAEGREEIGDGLDRFDHAEGLHGRDLGADLGQLHEDHVAQLLLGEGGDAHARLVSLELRPLVLLGVAEVRRNVRHHALLGLLGV
jgi:hypothetical protein